MSPFHDEISGNNSFSPECSFLSRLSTSFSACPVSSTYLFRAATRCGSSSVFRRSRTSTPATAERAAADMNSYISTHGSANGLLVEAGNTTIASSNISSISTLVAPRLSRSAIQLAKSVVAVRRLSKGYRNSSDLRRGLAFRAWRASRRRSALGFLPLNRVSSTCSSLGPVRTSYPGFPILGVFRLKGQPKRDDGMIFGSCRSFDTSSYSDLESRLILSGMPASICLAIRKPSL